LLNYFSERATDLALIATVKQKLLWNTINEIGPHTGVLNTAYGQLVSVPEQVDLQINRTCEYERLCKRRVERMICEYGMRIEH